MKMVLIEILVCFLFQTKAMAGYLETLDLTVGVNHVCANTTSGLKCFGDAEALTLKVPATLKNPRQLSGGNRFTCLIDNNVVRCFGEIPGTTKTDLTIGSDQLKMPKLLSVGYSHACAVGLNDKMKCWGSNDSAESKPPLLKNISELSLGMQQGCAIAENNVYCWGNKTFGSLDVPLDLKNPRNLTSGWWHHCVETDDGIKCWGYPYQNFTTPDDPSIKDFQSGGMFNCAIVDFKVKCWNETGRTFVIENTMGATKIAAGSTHACAITAEHGIVCWKYSNTGSFKNMSSYVPDGNIKDITKIASSNGSLCVLGDDDTLKCRGKNFGGALNVPSKIAGPVLKMTSGQQRTCLLLSDGTLSCYGSYIFDQDMPANLGPVDYVSSGGFHVCAGNKEKVTCWGDDMRDVFSVPPGLKNISAIESGFTHACAVADNEVVCWGGTGLISGINPPVKIKNPKAICAGGTFSCAIMSNGNVSCWGKQIPLNGEFIPNKDKVLEVPKLTNAEELSCGLSHACAIANGKIKCWGVNTAGLNPGVTLKNPHSLSVGYSHSCSLSDRGLYCWGNTTPVSMPDYSLVK